MAMLMLSPTKKVRLSPSDVHPLYGRGLETLRDDRLPTKLEVVNHVRFLKGQYSQNALTPTVKFGIYSSVAKTLLGIYQSAFIPSFGKNPKYAATKLQDEIEDELGYVRKNPQTVLASEESKCARLSDLNKIHHLLIKCKCFESATSLDDIKPENCHCSTKIPSLDFYADQCFGRSQRILFCEADKIRFQTILDGKFKVILYFSNFDSKRCLRFQNNSLLIGNLLTPFCKSGFGQFQVTYFS